MSTAPVVLAGRCAHCGGSVTLTESIWERVVARDGHLLPRCDPAVQRATWNCPYCDKENEGGFPGKIALATKANRHREYRSVTGKDVSRDQK